MSAFIISPETMQLAVAPIAVSDWRHGDKDCEQLDKLGQDLYRWLDSQGAVRYTRDRSRIPSNRRDTVVKVIRGSSAPSWTPVPQSQSQSQSVTTIPTPPTVGGLPPASPTPPLQDDDAASDPFNAPIEARQVTTEVPSGSSQVGVTSWPELDSRIAELTCISVGIGSGCSLRARPVQENRTKRLVGPSMVSMIESASSSAAPTG